MLRTQAFKLGSGFVVLASAVAVNACGGGGGGSGGAGGAGGSGVTSSTTTSGSSKSSTTTSSTAASTSATTATSSGSGTSSSSGGNAFTCAGVMPPAAGTITDFTTVDAMGNWGMGAFAGGIFNYPAAITADDKAMALHASGMVADYSGFGMYFNTCTDASAFKGVQFDIKGNAGKSGMVTLSIQTNETSPIDPVNMKGACMFSSPATEYTDCVPPSAQVAVTAGGATVKVMFAATAGGKPVAVASPNQLLGLQWSFAWAGPGDTPYAADVTVDNVQFIP